MNLHMYIKNYNTTQQLNTHQIVVVVIQFTKENSEWSILCKNQQNEIFWGNKKKIEDQAKIGRGGGMSSMNDVSQEDRFLPSASPHLGLSQLFFLARMTGILGDLFFFYYYYFCMSFPNCILALLCSFFFASLSTNLYTHKIFCALPNKNRKVDLVWWLVELKVLLA